MLKYRQPIIAVATVATIVFLGLLGWDYLLERKDYREAEEDQIIREINDSLNNLESSINVHKHLHERL